MLVCRPNALCDFEFLLRIVPESHSGAVEVRHQISPLLPPRGTYYHCCLILFFCTLDMELVSTSKVIEVISFSFLQHILNTIISP